MSPAPLTPPTIAIALSYEPEKSAAPVIVAKGKGVIAENIVALAKHHNITVYQDATLISLLEKIDIGSEIPLEAYLTVAEILRFVYSARS